jgi:hypothetical protein
MSYLDNIKGKKIIDLQFLTETYYPIKTEKEDKSEPQTVPSIWLDLGDYKITITNPITLENTPGDIYTFLNKIIINVVESDKHVCIVTSDGQKLNIDLSEDAYVGPEAIVLYGPNDLIVVW